MSARNYMRDIEPESGSGEPPERSIRDFRPSAARQRLQVNRPEVLPEAPQFDRPRRSRLGIWIAAIIAFLVLAGAAALVFLPSTSVTIVPRTHVVSFDSTNPLTAYPADSAATGTITYTLTTETFEDFAVVEANGTEMAEEKATGSVVVYNETNRVMRLIKNTRFQSPDGLIFRIPASVDVPAMQGTSAGTASVTVFADETGPKYNIGPLDKLTLPGLKSSPDFSKVYAKSTTAFTGGFSGERPAVSAVVLEAARAEVRGRLNERARLLWKTVPEGSLAFPGLVAVSYATRPPTDEPGNGVRIHEQATVALPVFSEASFARSIAQAVSADAEGHSMSIRFSDTLSAAPVGSLDAANIGHDAILFALFGKGQIIWMVDEGGLREALAGREEAAFEPIIEGFPSIEEARARLMPFWKHAFPQDAADIKLVVEEAPTF